MPRTLGRLQFLFAPAVVIFSITSLTVKLFAFARLRSFAIKIDRRSCRRTSADRSLSPREPLILEYVPVLGQHPVRDAHHVGGYPVSRQSGAGEATVDNHEIAFGHDHSRITFEGRGTGLDEVEETFATRLDVRCAGCSSATNIARPPQCIECFEGQAFCSFFRSTPSLTLLPLAGQLISSTRSG